MICELVQGIHEQPINVTAASLVFVHTQTPHDSSSSAGSHRYLLTPVSARCPCVGSLGFWTLIGR